MEVIVIGSALPISPAGMVRTVWLPWASRPVPKRQGRGLNVCLSRSIAGHGAGGRWRFESKLAIDFVLFVDEVLNARYRIAYDNRRRRVAAGGRVPSDLLPCPALAIAIDFRASR